MSFSLQKLVVISPEGKRKLVVDVLSRLGASDPECPNQADVLTEAEPRGHHSHGLQQLPVLATHI
jgi:LDH2 family malate/lactate/ureidoglycolate dehydrogenase